MIPCKENIKEGYKRQEGGFKFIWNIFLLEGEGKEIWSKYIKILKSDKVGK